MLVQWFDIAHSLHTDFFLGFFTSVFVPLTRPNYKATKNSLYIHWHPSIC